MLPKPTMTRRPGKTTCFLPSMTGAPLGGQRSGTIAPPQSQGGGGRKQARGGMRHALSHFSLDNPEQIMYKSASWAIRIDFEQRLVAADSLQKQPSGVSATRAA